jgi:hypothetical protein
MRRILLVLAMAAMLVAMLSASAAPVVADNFGDLGSRLFDEHEGLFDDDDDDGLVDRGGPICFPDDEQAELIVGFGFVCVEADDRHDVFDDDDDHHDVLD